MLLAPRNEYLANEVLTATPARLIELLYEHAITTLETGRECARSGDIAGRGRCVNKVFAILVELGSSLDFEAGREIAQNYARLYDYCQRRLLQAHVEQSETMMAEVQTLIGELREAWQVVVAHCMPRCLSDEELTIHNTKDEETLRFDCVG